MSDATIERTDEQVTLRYERRLRHPVEEVWKAITEPDQIEKWFGSRPDIDLRVGGEYVSYHQTGDRVVDRIVRLDPPRLLEHTFWVHINPDARVTYELAPGPEGCVLTLTHTLTMDDLRSAAATYSWAGEPLEQVPRTASGWHRLLDRLQAGLDGRAVEFSQEDMAALQERYASQLG